MSLFSVSTIQFIFVTLLGFVGALFALMVVVGVVRYAVRRAMNVVEPDPNAVTYPTNVPWV